MLLDNVNTISVFISIFIQYWLNVSYPFNFCHFISITIAIVGPEQYDHKKPYIILISFKIKRISFRLASRPTCSEYLVALSELMISSQKARILIGQYRTVT